MSLSARVQHQLALYSGPLSVLFLLVGILALGAAGNAYLDPPVEEIPSQEVDVQEFETTVETSAVIINDTVLYDRNKTEQLRNRPRYFIGPTPTLQLHSTTDVPADRQVFVSTRIVLRLEATADETVIWENETELAQKNATVEDGQFVTNASVHIPTLRNEVAEVRNAIGTVGSLSPSLLVQTTYKTTSVESDDVYNGNLTITSGIQITGNGYWLSGDLSASETERTVIPGGEREGEPNLGNIIGLSLLGIVGLLIGSGIRYWSRDVVDLEELETEINRSQYSDWISDGDLPAGNQDEYVYINSLEDLVDIAIDMNRRVIYDSDVETYFVVDGDLLYYHAIDRRTVESWLDLS